MECRHSCSRYGVPVDLGIAAVQGLIQVQTTKEKLSVDSGLVGPVNASRLRVLRLFLAPCAGCTSALVVTQPSA
eukprot:651500-Amphidinium_carterae.1